MHPNCETCRWYIYPLMTSGKLTTHLLPIVIADKRYCSRGWCEYEKREEDTNDSKRSNSHFTEQA